ncbi:MAG: hypothetical protein QOI76_3798 [Frankiales bacterium]|nr:hypothetical protein [Frankiales bacterium]
MSAQPPYRPPTSPPPGYPPRNSGRGWVIAAAVVVLAIVAGLAYWLGGRTNNSTPTAGTTPTGTAGAQPSSGHPSASAAASVPASGPASASARVSSAPVTSAAPTTTSSAATTSASPSPTTTVPSHPNPDFGYVTAVTTSGSITKLSFDRATLLTGPAASSAATAHGEQIQDDYFIVNDNKLIRTFELSPSVVVTGSSNLSGDFGPKPSTLAALKTWVAANPTYRLPVDLSYDATGKVTKIAEVFFP